MTSIRVIFGSNVAPRRRIRPKQAEWRCVCVVAGRVKVNPAWLTRCGVCGTGRP